MLPVIKQPKANVSEAWHFDCRGSHQIVYQYYADGKGTNFPAYKAAAASGILSIGVHVDDFTGNQKEATIQACLIRLGKEIGNIDGQLGRKSHTALEELGISFNLNNVSDMMLQVENLMQHKFPTEFVMPAV